MFSTTLESRNMLKNELVGLYFEKHEEQQKQLMRQVYPELLEFIRGLGCTKRGIDLTPPDFIVSMISSKILLLGENPSHITGNSITQKIDQDVFDFEIQNPFWSDQRVYQFSNPIIQIIGEQPLSAISEIFKYLAALAVDELIQSSSVSSTG